jgi:hypothetical protein
MKQVDFIALARNLRTLDSLPPESEEPGPDWNRWNPASRSLIQLADQLQELGCGCAAEVRTFGHNLCLRETWNSSLPEELDALESETRDGAKAQAIVLRQIVNRELNELHFRQVPEDRRKLLDIPREDWLGENYAVRFADAIEFRDDLERALTCYAYGEGTACVFHLMMLFEAPIKAFKIAAKIPDKAKTWVAVTEAYEKKRKEIPDEQQVKFDSIARCIKLTARHWRNQVMHGVSDFTIHEARGVIDPVCAMVREIADTIDSKGRVY